MSADILYDGLAILILAVWFLVSVLAQFPAFQRIRSKDYLSIIPNWSFFAPKPLTHDYHLLYRDHFGDKTVSSWIEVPIVEPRGWWCMLWNPKRRQRKSLFDLTNMLIKVSKKAKGVHFQTSVPYLLLLQYVSNLPHHTAAVATQFALMNSEGILSAREPRVMFLSGFHGVEGVTEV